MPKSVKAFSIDAKVTEAIAKEAKKQSRSVSNLVNMVLSEYIRQMQMAMKEDERPMEPVVSTQKIKIKPF